MSRHKYTVKMIYNDGGENFTIGPEHIVSFIIDYAYISEVIQPLIMVNVNLDKNFIDRMIKNKQTARIQFIVQKINISVDVTNPIYENYINTSCMYELMDDLYNEKTLMYDKNDTRKDVFAQTTLGLASSTLIDRNTKAFDCILKGGNMMGAVCYFTSHMPMIIEPFDHNNQFEKELIVPPTETVKQMMDFLNSIHVFYDTKYRLYFDFNCTYLLSMKGIAVPAKGEEYNRVTIRVVEPKEDSYDAFEQGISRDSRNKTYTIKMMSKNTHFYRDNTLDKQFNQLVGVIDPSRQKSVHDGLFTSAASNSLISSASNVLDAVRERTDAVKDNINSVVEGRNIVNYNVSEIKDTRDDFNTNTATVMGQASKVASKYINQLSALLAANDSTMHDSYYSYRDRYDSKAAAKKAEEYAKTGKYSFTTNIEALKLMSNHMTTSLGNTPKATMDAEPDMESGQDTFNDLAKNSTNTGYSITSITGHIDGVKAPDIHTNIFGMKKLCGDNIKKCDQCSELASDSKDSMDSSSDQMNKACSTATNALRDQIQLIQDTAKKVAELSGDGASGGSGGRFGNDAIILQMEKDLEPIKETYNHMVQQASYIGNCFQEISAQTDNGVNLANNFNTMQQEITPNVDALYDIHDMLKEQFDPLKKVTDILAGISITDEQLEEYYRIDQETQDKVTAYLQRQNENYDKMIEAQKKQEEDFLKRYEGIKAPVKASYEQMKKDVEEAFQNYIAIINGVRTPLIEEINARYSQEKFEFDVVLSEKVNIENAQYMADEKLLQMERDNLLAEEAEDYKTNKPLFTQELKDEAEEFKQLQIEQTQEFQAYQQAEYDDWVNDIPRMEEERRAFMEAAELELTQFDEETVKIYDELVSTYEDRYDQTKADHEREVTEFFKDRVQQQADMRRNYIEEESCIKTAVETSLQNLKDSHDWNKENIIAITQDLVSALNRDDPEYHQKYDAIVSKEREDLKTIDDDYKNESYELNEYLRIELERLDREFSENSIEHEKTTESEYQNLLTTQELEMNQIQTDIESEWSYIKEMRDQDRLNLIDEQNMAYDELLDSQDIEKKLTAQLNSFNEEMEQARMDFSRYQEDKLNAFENYYSDWVNEIKTNYSTKKSQLDSSHNETLDRFAEENKVFLQDYERRLNAETDEVNAVHKEDYLKYEKERDKGLEDAERWYKEQLQPIEEQEQEEAAALLEAQKEEAVQFLQNSRETMLADYTNLTIYTQEYLGYINWLVEEHNKYLLDCYQEVMSREPVFRINRFGLLSGGLGGLVNSIKSITPAISNFKIQDMAKANGALSSLGISSGNIGELLNNATKFGDLSAVGLLGLTSIKSSALKFGSGGSASNGGRIKYVRLNNDDPNKLKNLEYESALRATTFSVVKEHIDNSIITPNKEYFVEHISELGHESGRYLLRHKTETYIREDELYTCKTGLELSRIPNQ